MSSGFENQTVINLTVNEDESKNFFTNLVNEKSNEKEIQLNENDIDYNNKTNEMLERVNSNQKTIGHNRFQQKIEELEGEINKYNLYKKEQEMKLNLFKKTISSLQTQLQQYSNVERPSDNTNIKLIEEQSERIKTLTLEISNFKLENESLNNKLNVQSLTINKLDNEKTSVITKYDALKNEYEKLNISNKDNINKLEKEISSKLDLQNKLNLELSLKENLEGELLILKSQSKTIELENIILSKDLIIEQLRNQLNKMETNLLSKTEDIKKEIKTTIKPTIQGRSRGLTNTIRGLNMKR